MRVEDPDRALKELLACARALSLEVRTEPLKAASGRAGGACRVSGRTVVLLDAGASTIDRVLALADALAPYDLDRQPLGPDAADAVHRMRSRPSQPRNSVGPLVPRDEEGGDATRFRGKPGIVSARPRKPD